MIHACNKVAIVKIFSYRFTFSYSKLLSPSAHCSMKVNIKTFFYSQCLFYLRYLLSSLSSPFFFDLGLSRYSDTLFPLSDSLSLWSWSRSAKCWDGGATRHGCVLRGNQLQEFVGFGGLVSVGFTGLIFFSLFLSPACFLSLFSFTPRGKPWDFGFGSEQKSKEMKMAGTMTAEKGWPERGFVEVWWVWGCGFVEDGRSEHGGGWLWVCGGGGLWVWDYGGGAVLWVCFRRKRRR